MDSLPSLTETVPIFGTFADELLDSFGFLQSTMVALHSAYIESHESSSDPRIHFVQSMAENGMAQKEASAIFTMIQNGGGVKLRYRHRPSLELQ